MIRRNRLRHRIISIGIALFATIFYNEFLVYEIQKYKWSSHDCTECVKILLVADPQILGEKEEKYKGGSLAIWDNDRYLAKTFSRALKHSQPHVIIFLGDLMNEGHIASTDEFNRYKRRFDNIFDTSENIMKIYLPGDNDIGGEDDMVSSNIHKRFDFAFSQLDTLVYKSVTFFKINRLVHSMPQAPKDAFLNDYTERNTTNIVLSHMPLLFMPGSFVQNVLKELSPQIIFTAHEHKAMHISFDTVTDQVSEIWILPPNETPLYQLRLDVGDIHELQIPTCSYRMGVPYMGFGLVYIDTQEKTAEFTILWLPNRFPQLLIYLIVSILTIVLIICICLSSCCSNRNAGYNLIYYNA
ncbi:metallophosphoesterase 1 homolog [Prorops nasuta]|uniref:metallophosphoesterase 1 homolog n=1 Tax=Prorops nasuta TaxID=863751 RepID=UPI0034D02045